VTSVPFAFGSNDAFKLIITQFRVIEFDRESIFNVQGRQKKLSSFETPQPAHAIGRLEGFVSIECDASVVSVFDNIVNEFGFFVAAPRAIPEERHYLIFGCASTRGGGQTDLPTSQ